MKHIIFVFLFVFCLAVGALSVRAEQQQKQYFPWAQSIAEETRSADFIYKVKSVFKTEPKRPSFTEVYRKLQKQVSISSQSELFLRRARILNAALSKNPVFKDYVFTVQFAADIGPDLPQDDFEYLHKFLASSYELDKFDTHYLPQQALHYENGTIYIQLENPSNAEQTPMFLIVNPRIKTVEFIYKDPQFDQQALEGRSYRLW